MKPGTVHIDSDAKSLRIEFIAEDMEKPGRAIFVALETDPLAGCAVVPYQHGAEGSTVFLPFRADRVYAARMGEDVEFLFKS